MIIDNFLSPNEFEYIKNIILDFDDCQFPWYYQPTVSHIDSDDGHYFTHSFFSLDRNQKSNYFQILYPILNKIKINQLIRAKANLFLKESDNLIIHDSHIDYPYEHSGCIFYLNTNDGYTILSDGTKIESIENRILFFNPYLHHSSTTCTNSKFRSNINFNYT
jgi:hypothetical protein